MKDKMVKIEIEKLQPQGTLDKAADLRKQDIARYIDKDSGMLREDISEHTNCMLCGKDETDLLFIKEGFRYVKCKECGLVYVNPRINKNKIEEFYSTGRFTFMFTNLYIPSAKYRQEVLYNERLDFIEQYIPNGRLLDVGSAAGHFVESAMKRGWDTYGIEVGNVGADFAKEKLNLKNIYNMTIDEAQFENDFFDVVTVWDVFEHLTEPLNTAKEIHRIIRKNGMIFVYVPNYNSVERYICEEKCDNIVPDAHLIYYTPDTIKGLLEKAGFKIVYLETRGIDIDHIIFNLKHYFNKKYDTKFIEEYKYILQEAFDKAYMGNWIRIFGKKEA